MKAKAGNPVHVNRNDDIKYHFVCLKTGWYGRWLSRLKNNDLSDHFAGKKTYYFTSDGRSAIPEVLVNLDIDCHMSDSLEGALDFAGNLPRKAVVEGAKKKVTGSIAGRHFDEDELGKMKDEYLSLAKDLLGGEVLVSSSRKVAKEEDLAVFLMLVKFFTENMNADGSLPTARWREMWTVLYESGGR